ncbi:MAG: 5'-methylthioadenosine/adenosylhomocysteine nucleosidase [Odoribacter sp.]|nr:5'-methylthioadenosine/adenosylhomocysteine nucleosidase [Odoribacter sp.]
MRIVIIVAMQSEYKLVAHLLENRTDKQINSFSYTHGYVAGKEILLGKSGIGKVSAAVEATQMILACRPDVIINTGVAGGLDKSLDVMDVVVGKRTIYHDVWCGDGNAYGQIQGLPAFFKSDENLYNLAIHLKSSAIIKGGLICSGDKFITSLEELLAIKSKFPEALAVDMESCSIAQVCYLFSVPFLSFRIISDTPGITNHTHQYENFWKSASETSFRVLQELIEKI